MKNAEFKVNGMQCGHCERRVCKNLLKTEGVKMASASFADKKVLVKYDENVTDESKVIKAIEGSGYTVVK